MCLPVPPRPSPSSPIPPLACVLLTWKKKSFVHHGCNEIMGEPRIKGALGSIKKGGRGDDEASVSNGWDRKVWEMVQPSSKITRSEEVDKKAWTRPERVQTGPPLDSNLARCATEAVAEAGEATQAVNVGHQSYLLGPAKRLWRGRAISPDSATAADGRTIRTWLRLSNLARTILCLRAAEGGPEWTRPANSLGRKLQVGLFSKKILHSPGRIFVLTIGENAQEGEFNAAH